MCKNQADFRASWGCNNQIFALRKILGHMHMLRRTTICVCSDVKSAFDSVSLGIL